MLSIRSLATAHAAALLAAAVLLAACSPGDDAPMADSPGTDMEADTAGAGAAAPGTRASAVLRDPSGAEVGTVQLSEGEGGVVTVEARVSGLAAGRHGIHVHETGRCEAPEGGSAFQSAGAHFNPTNAGHGLEDPEGPHAGDLPNLEVGDDGAGSLRATTDRVTLGTGERSLFDADGSALVVHADEDDQRTDPSGNSGDRVACGVIERR